MSGDVLDYHLDLKYGHICVLHPADMRWSLSGSRCQLYRKYEHLHNPSSSVYMDRSTPQNVKKKNNNNNNLSSTTIYGILTKIPETLGSLTSLHQIKKLKCILWRLFTYKSRVWEWKSPLWGGAHWEFSRRICLTLICRGGNMTGNVEIPDLSSLHEGFTVWVRTLANARKWSIVIINPSVLFRDDGCWLHV